MTIGTEDRPPFLTVINFWWTRPINPSTMGGITFVEGMTNMFRRRDSGERRAGPPVLVPGLTLFSVLASGCSGLEAEPRQIEFITYFSCPGQSVGVRGKTEEVTFSHTDGTVAVSCVLDGGYPPDVGPTMHGGSIESTGHDGVDRVLGRIIVEHTTGQDPEKPVGVSESDRISQLRLPPGARIQEVDISAEVPVRQTEALSPIPADVFGFEIPFLEGAHTN